MPKLDEYMTITEAAEFLGVCKNTLRNWGNAGKVPEHRHPVNNYRLYRRDELQALLDGAESPNATKQSGVKPR
jgi:excisionase family DNA binding protein